MAELCACDRRSVASCATFPPKKCPPVHPKPRQSFSNSRVSKPCRLWHHSPPARPQWWPAFGGGANLAKPQQCLPTMDDDADSLGDFVEVDVDGELGTFVSSPPHSRHASRREADARRSQRVGVVWLFAFNAVLPLLLGAFTCVSAVAANNNASVLPWLTDGHNLGLLHAAMFVVVLVIWATVACVHRRNRADGFLTFYRNTRRVKDAPLLAVGIGNGVCKGGSGDARVDVQHLSACSSACPSPAVVRASARACCTCACSYTPTTFVRASHVRTR
jgi:hypothetical protein